MSRPPPNRIPDDIRAKIAARVRDVGTKEVAWEFGVAVSTVRAIRDEAGIPPRATGNPCFWGKALVRKIQNYRDGDRMFTRIGQRPLTWATGRVNA